MCFMAIPIVTALAGGIVQGVGAANQAESEAQAAEARAQQAERQAILETDVGGIEAGKLRRRGQVLIAEQINAFAGGGIDVGQSGSAAVVESTAQELDEDIQAIAFNAELRADNEEFRADLERAQAADARASKGLRFAAPVISGIGQAGRFAAQAATQAGTAF